MATNKTAARPSDLNKSVENIACLSAANPSTKLATGASKAARWFGSGIC